MKITDKIKVTLNIHNNLKNLEHQPYFLQKSVDVCSNIMQVPKLIRGKPNDDTYYYFFQNLPPA